MTFFILLNSNSYSQSLVINELMSSNGITIADEDGDYSDWFELYNTGQLVVDLNGFGISDDPSNPFKFVLPQVVLYPQDQLLIFASDKK